MDTRFAADMAATFNQQVGWIFGFFTLLLQTAVVVGVLSLGILALRAAIERRRTIGSSNQPGCRSRSQRLPRALRSSVMAHGR